MVSTKDGEEGNIEKDKLLPKNQKMVVKWKKNGEVEGKLKRKDCIVLYYERYVNVPPN